MEVELYCYHIEENFGEHIATFKRDYFERYPTVTILDKEQKFEPGKKYRIVIEAPHA